MPGTLRFIAVAIFCCVTAAFGPASRASAQEAIFVVRHAERQDDSKDSPLSSEGRARAARLAQILRDARITALYVTEFQRTSQTAQPLADLLNVQITKIPAEDEQALVARLRSSGPHARVLVVSHSDRLPALLNDLGSPQAITIPANQYDDLFVVIPHDRPASSIVLRLHY